MAETLRRGEGDPVGGGVAVAGGVFALALVLVILLLESAYYRAADREWQEKVVAAKPEELSRVRAEQEEKLSSYRWVDPVKKIVAIPIERAMELEVRDLADSVRAPGAPAPGPAAPGAER